MKELFTLLTLWSLTTTGNFLLAQGRWWQCEPIRLLQTNLRETDAGLDEYTVIVLKQ